MVTAGTSATDVAMRLINSSGSVISDSDYDYGNRGLLAYNPFQDERLASADSIQKFGQADQEPEGTSIVAYIFSPSDSTSYTFVAWENSYNFGSGAGGGAGVAVLTEFSSITGFQVYAVSQTRPFNTSKIRTYGLRTD